MNLSRHPVIVRLITKLLRRRVILKRRMPKRYGGWPILVSPDIAVRLWHPRLEKFDRPLLEWAEEFVKRGDVVWDIGANMGMFALAAAHCAGPAGRVVAVEPDAWVADLLYRSSQYGKGERAEVTVLPAAVSEAVGISELHIAERGRGRNYLEEAGGHESAGGAREVHTVVTVTLDWLMQHFPSPSVLKIDVEGGEVGVLQGGRNLLSKAQPIILCEVLARNTERVTDLLRLHGYDIFDLCVSPAARVPLERAVFNTLAIPQKLQ